MDGRWNHVGGIRDHGSSQYPDLGGNNLIAQGGQEPYNKTRNGDQVQTYAAGLLINVEVVCFNLALRARAFLSGVPLGLTEAGWAFLEYYIVAAV